MIGVSIIVPNYNHERFLRERIESILAQTYQNFEMVLLDDKSSDASKRIIEEYSKHPKVSKVVYNESNSQSPFSQWKKGLSMANNELVWIAESDDFSSPFFLEETLKGFNDPDVLLSYCQSIDINPEGQQTNRIYWTEDVGSNNWKQDFTLHGRSFLPFLFKKNVIPNVSACIIKTVTLKKIIDENPQVSQLKYAGDWLLWLALCGEKNCKISFTSKPLNYFRESPQSTRHQSDIGRKRTRIKEELLIFLSKRYLYSAEAISDKMELLKQNWFAVHGKKHIGAVFFSIAPLLKISPITLFLQYIRFKWAKK